MTREQLLLIKLMEECAEVTQACSKALRFGINDFHTKYGNTPNRELISQELHDLVTAAFMLASEKTIPHFLKPMDASKKRVEKYIKISQDIAKGVCNDK